MTQNLASWRRAGVKVVCIRDFSEPSPLAVLNHVRGVAGAIGDLGAAERHIDDDFAVSLFPAAREIALEPEQIPAMIASIESLAKPGEVLAGACAVLRGRDALWRADEPLSSDWSPGVK